LARQNKKSLNGSFYFAQKGFERALIKQSGGLFLARSVDEPIALLNKIRFEMKRFAYIKHIFGAPKQKEP